MDQYGRPFDLEKRPIIGNKIKVPGRTIQFYHVNQEAAGKLGYRAG